MRATFVAAGLARFVFSLIGHPPQVDVQIKDVGSAFLLQTSATRAEIVRAARKHGLPQLLPALLKQLTPTEQKRLDQGVPLERLYKRYVPSDFPSSNIIDYPTERDRWRATAGSVHDLAEDVSAPDPRLPLWAHLCSQFGLSVNMKRTYPLLVHLWFAHQRKWAARLCELILDHYSSFFSDQPKSWADCWLQEIMPHLDLSGLKQFKWTKTNTQVKALALVSPSTIQGSNTTKAGQRPSNVTLDLFWIEMYLAYAGC